MPALQPIKLKQTFPISPSSLALGIRLELRALTFKTTPSYLKVDD